MEPILKQTQTNPSLTKTHSLAARLGMSWSHFLNDGAANYLPGILPAVLIAMNQPVSMAGAIMGVLLFGQALQPLMGWIADRFGGKSLLMIGLLASSSGGALIGIANEIWVLFALLLLIGLGNAAFHPQALSGIRSMVKEKQGLWMSVFLIGGEVGRGAWPTMASWLVVHYGMISLIFLFLPTLLTIPFLWRWAPTLPANKSKKDRIKWRDHAWSLTLLLGFAGSRAFVTYSIVTFIPVLWNLRGGSLISGASIITTFIVVGVIGNLSGGYLSDILGKRAILIISGILLIVFTVLIFQLQGVWLWIVAGLAGIAAFSGGPITIMIGQDIFPENRSLGSGIALGLSNGIGALLVVIAGLWMNDAHRTAVFAMIDFFAVFSLLLTLLFPKRLLR